MNFLQEHFDKMLLVAVFAGLVIVVLHMSHDQSDVAAVKWAR